MGFVFLFYIYILILIYCFKYETIETHARAFLTLNILAIGRVVGLLYKFTIEAALENAIVELAPTNQWVSIRLANL